ncbi:hypothetical protein [Saccharibacillus sacchari]|uniref:Uncharacterized protein n=1 Tax=Saccharibacillus sacchari TaxID=456493 RepID=A0ACC6PJJ5_9BACL
MLHTQEIRRNTNELELADRLYHEAFPENEQIPMSFLLFYLAHGYRNANYRMIHASEGYEVLSKGEELIPYEFLLLFKKYLGWMLYLFFKPKLVLSQSVSSAPNTGIS